MSQYNVERVYPSYTYVIPGVELTVVDRGPVQISGGAREDVLGDLGDSLDTAHEDMSLMGKVLRGRYPELGRLVPLMRAALRPWEVVFFDERAGKLEEYQAPAQSHHSLPGIAAMMHGRSDTGHSLWVNTSHVREHPSGDIRPLQAVLGRERLRSNVSHEVSHAFFSAVIETLLDHAGADEHIKHLFYLVRPHWLNEGFAISRSHQWRRSGTDRYVAARVYLEEISHLVFQDVHLKTLLQTATLNGSGVWSHEMEDLELTMAELYGVSNLLFLSVLGLRSQSPPSLLAAEWVMGALQWGIDRDDTARLTRWQRDYLGKVSCIFALHGVEICNMLVDYYELLSQALPDLMRHTNQATYQYPHSQIPGSDVVWGSDVGDYMIYQLEFLAEASHEDVCRYAGRLQAHFREMSLALDLPRVRTPSFARLYHVHDS